MRALAVTRDGRTLFSGSYDGAIRVWAVTSGGGGVCVQHLPDAHGPKGKIDAGENEGTIHDPQHDFGV